MQQQVKHGTNRGWVELGCRKRCCVLAHSRFLERGYELRRSRGLPPKRIPIEVVRNHIRKLQENHQYTLAGIARLSGVPRRQVSDWMTRGAFAYSKNVFKVLELGVEKSAGPPEESRHASFVDSTGTTRRLQSAYYRGFTPKLISELSGVSSTVIKSLVSGKQRNVSPENRDRIKSFTESSLLLQDPEGRYADQVRRRAREEGYLPFGVWDNIDDPDCEPELEEPEYSDPVLQDGVERCRSLAARGFTVGEIADVCGIPRPNLHKIVHGKKKQVTPETAKKIHMGCDQLDVLPDSTGPFAERARSVAKRNGWS